MRADMNAEQTEAAADRRGATVPEGILRALSDVAGYPVAEADVGRRLGELGIDSMGALRLQRRLKQDGLDVGLVDLHGEATPASVAAALRGSAGDGFAMPGDGDEGAGGDSRRAALEFWDDFAADPEGALTPVQQAYWAGRGDDFALGGVASWWFTEYDIPVDGRGDAADTADRLEVAWRRVVAAHPMLRTSVGRDGRREVAVHDVRDWTMDRVDLRDSSDAERELETLRAGRSHRVPDPAAWPLFEVTAVLLPGGGLRLLVGIDVLVIDFESWTVIMREWEELFEDPAADPAEDPGFGKVLARRAGDPAHRRLVARDAAWWAGRPLNPAPMLPVGEDDAGPRFERERLRLDAGTVVALSSECAARGIGLTAVLAAVYSLVLDRVRVGGNPFSINVTLNDRPEGAGGVVGDFTSTGILDVPADSDRMTFARFAAELGRELWDVMDHRRVPAVLERRRRGGAAGDDGIVFTSAIGGPRPPSGGVFARRVAGVSQTPQVLVDHIVWDEGDGIEMVWDHRTGGWPDGFWRLVVDAERRVLHDLARGRGWDEHGVMWDPAGEAPDEAPNPGPRPLLHQPWQSAAETMPGKVAVSAAGESVTHGALLERAAAVAAGLAAGGLEPGEPVMVAYPKCVDQIAAILGVLMTGGAYVPVDPAWPGRRAESIRTRTGARVLIRPADAGSAVPEGMRTVDVRGLSSVGSRTAPPEAPEPSELAYVIFTSGSTGDPKGVAIEHRQARATIDDIGERYGIDENDVVLGVAALSFDLSVHDVFGTMGAGGHLVLPEPERSRDPQHWLDLMRAHGVTVWNSAPPMLEMLVEYAEYVPEAKEAFASLRLVMLSGDWIPVTLPDRLRALAPKAEVHSLGGATEAAIWSITHPIGEVDPTAPSIPYGRGIRGQWFHVLDEDGRPCRVGVPGELWIGGAGVARGYIGDEERTAERFSVHPLLGQRLYRTGDLGKWRYDGEIDFLGRLDRQVKVGGHRIELGEVEAALLRLPEVSSAIAQAVPGPDGRPRLVAHVVPAGREGTGDDACMSRRLADSLAEQVPASMIPSRIVFRDAMPVTDNGKIDVKALENPFAPSTGDGGRLQPQAPAGPGGGVQAQSNVGADPAPGPSAEQADSTATGRSNDGGAGVSPEVPARPGHRGDRSWETVLGGFAGGPPWPDRAPSDCGATSIDLVRLANAMEDVGLERPDFDELMNRLTVREIAVLCEGAAAGRTPDFRQTPLAGSFEAGAQAATGPDGVAPTAGLPALLRELADRLETLDAELAAVRDLIGAAAASAAGATPVPASAPTRAPAPATGKAPDDSGGFPLTEMQLAYLAGRAGDSSGRAVAPHYYAESEVRDLDPVRLQEVCDATVAAHPMLRTALGADARQVEQIDAALTVEVADHSALSARDRDAALRRIRDERESRLLAVDRAPMIRLLAVNLGDGRWRLHADLDLLFMDARSALLVFREVAARYRGEDPGTGGRTGSFRDWATAVASADRSAARAYWAERARTMPPGPDLPEIEGAHPARFSRRRMIVSAPAWRAICDRARAAGATATCVVIDALAESLGDPEPQSYVLTVADVPAGHENVVGDYTGTMVLSVDPRLPADRRLRDLASGFWTGLGHATGVGGVHGNEVLRVMRTDGRRLPRVAVSSAVGGVPGDASSLLDVFGGTSYAISQTPNVVLDVQIFELPGGGAVLNWDFAEEAFPDGWIDDRFAGFAELLGGDVIVGRGARPRATAPRGGIIRASEGNGAVTGIGSGSGARRILRHLADILGDPALDGGDVSGNVARTPFFELGATSIQLVELHRKLVGDGAELDVLDVFSHPTAERLGAVVDSAGVRSAVESGAAGGGDSRRRDPLARARARGARRAAAAERRLSR